MKTKLLAYLRKCDKQLPPTLPPEIPPIGQNQVPANVVVEYLLNGQLVLLKRQTWNEILEAFDERQR